MCKATNEQDLNVTMVPPMLIQPFVENGILYGIDLYGKVTSNWL
ncbi:hypothetical protein OMO38_00585 [Chryseobacterium sp. 09-1422]|uniref:Uncharacterized protein n=1 Tax=Chryseobacterium kimseyorum TaxID=2984028 RepID=A0ABT3HT95_9FLAO|nr:hypothetical protein [Chryseobacterium kimseyorum]MCW3167010.1 hypothetical protein [Chryseobacterium kimseyorum]